MSLASRLKKAQKTLPSPTKKDLDPKIKWLIDNCQEYRDCFKNIYRLTIKAGMPISRLGEWDDDLREQAKVNFRKMDIIYKETKE